MRGELIVNYVCRWIHTRLRGAGWNAEGMDAERKRVRGWVGNLDATTDTAGERPGAHPRTHAYALLPRKRNGGGEEMGEGKARNGWEGRL